MKYYTDEKNVQMLISLMKAHGIKRIIASPGTTNIAFVGSVQNDAYFEIYSSVDERSAAYMACGLAAETGEPVALSCTGATASRNYFPGLTEAFYRDLPVLAITSTQHTGRVGQNIAQVIDRSSQPKDTVRLSVQIPSIGSEEDAWACNLQINRALLELCRHGGGPVHINLATSYSRNFSVKELPSCRVIRRFGYGSETLPSPDGKIALFVGNHRPWSDRLTKLVDMFCEKYNAVVFHDQTSNYNGKYGVLIGNMPGRMSLPSDASHLDLLIHFGNVSASGLNLIPQNVWYIHPDGEIRDTFRRLSAVFEMEEEDFFWQYTVGMENEKQDTSFAKAWQQAVGSAKASESSDIPFSSVWIAGQTIDRIPEGSMLHLGILTSLESWNKFPRANNITVVGNTGGFGIDGILSTTLGASLANSGKLYFCVLGDLAFFYDMNALGNRHVGSNLRILLVNNGHGHTMRSRDNPGRMFGDDADRYIAAAGHFGNMSSLLVKHYAEDLGFEYLSASSKEEYLEKVGIFTDPSFGSKPLVFEVFIDPAQENEAQDMWSNRRKSDMVIFAETAAKKLVGGNSVRAIKRFIKKYGG